MPFTKQACVDVLFDKFWSTTMTGENESTCIYLNQP